MILNNVIQSVKYRLLHVGYDRLNRDWDYKNVISPFVRLFLIHKGTARASFTNQAFNLKEGYMYLIPSFTYNSYGCDNYHEQYYVGFFEEIQQGMSVFNLKHFNYEVKATAMDYKLFKRLLEVHPDKRVNDTSPKAHINSRLLRNAGAKEVALNYDIETQGILGILLSRFVSNADVFENSKPMEGDFNKVLVFISKHLKETLTVKDLANYCNLSPDHFTRNFKANFGVTPNKYIQVRRIERAQFLLLSTKDSLEQISASVGMPNMSYFSRKFKEIVGVTPGTFRKKQRNITKND